MSLSCEHVTKYRNEKGTKSYLEIYSLFVECSTQIARKKKIEEGFCHTCKTRSQRLHACLDCRVIGCYNRNHIQNHVESSGHYLGIELTFGHIYCFICKDYMYDSEFKNKTKSPYPPKLSNVFWQPDEKEAELYKECFGKNKVIVGQFVGLRGLVNLGQTCYMNCIVQVLTHNPLLRDYFLSAQHTKFTCKSPMEGGKCLACEMDNIFQEFYSGTPTPYIPHTLYILWKDLLHLKGYEPQDAHEFYLNILEILHKHSSGEMEEKDCQCIIHQIYTGFLQSDLQCEQCKNKRTYSEEFRDIGLDLANNNGSESISLFDCLERFTHPEQVTTQCDSCQHGSSTKQLTLQKLPIVISFHLKRLEYGKKINTFVSFPEYLDMTPFVSSKRGSSFETNGDKHCNFSKSIPDNNHYSLFAVVNHSGDKGGGHYISFIRRKLKWYKCDDHLITFANLQDVLKSEGYILFYHKEIIEYEGDSDERK